MSEDLKVHAHIWEYDPQAKTLLSIAFTPFRRQIYRQIHAYNLYIYTGLTFDQFRAEAAPANGAFFYRIQVEMVSARVNISFAVMVMHFSCNLKSLGLAGERLVTFKQSDLGNEERRRTSRLSLLGMIRSTRCPVLAKPEKRTQFMSTRP